MCKTDEEMKVIKQKLSISNSGANNGMSKSIKALNVQTGEVLHFETIKTVRLYFGIKHKSIFSKHANGKATNFYRDAWTFAYEKDEFNTNLQNFDPSTRNGIKVKITNMDTKKKRCLTVLASVKAYLGAEDLCFYGLKEPVMFENYIVERL